ncbi:MAG TPA: response regulator [Vicinamibacterales bacterium]|jgi:CheY-like chemotaxis protein|nr:response regulator [Vicinamibacterales bacterium]
MKPSVRTVSGPVLVVEDDADMRGLLVATLTSAGFRVVTAENGLEALEQLRRQRPCVVVLDLAMPFLDGAGFVHAAQADPEFPPVPIVCVSGMPGARAVAKQLGVADCLTKPFASDALIEAILRNCGLSDTS